MGNQKESFDILLEKYVFGAAAQFIDQADSETQAKIIALLNYIGKPTPLVSASTNGVSLEFASIAPAKSYDVELERRWKETLRKPDRKRRIKKERHGVTRRMIDLHQIRMDSTIFCIGQLKRLLKLSQKNLSNTDRKSHLINHYQSIIDSKTAYLTKMQALHQEKLTKVQA